MSEHQLMLTGLRFGKCVNSKNYQPAIIISDCSTSMEGVKKKQETDAIKDLLDKLAQPENKNAHHISIVACNDDAEIVRDFSPAQDILNNFPALVADGNTNITASLQAAHSLIGKYPNYDNINWQESIVLLLSDGMHNVGESPIEEANLIKNKATIVTVGFGPDADKELLKKLASSEQHFFHCDDGIDLRGFMADIGDTLTDSAIAGTNVKNDITKLKG